MKAVIGLGNPGAQYAKTRHNLGFVCVDHLAEALQIGEWTKFKDGELIQGKINGEKVFLFKPMQFMNTSGMPIRALMDYFGLLAKDVVIIADDVYIEPGKARVRLQGGDGGHNGWKSVLEHVEGSDFTRIRVGAGFYKHDLEERATLPALEAYVLQKIPLEDQKRIDLLIDKLMPNLINWLTSQDELQEETIHI